MLSLDYDLIFPRITGNYLTNETCHVKLDLFAALSNESICHFEEAFVVFTDMSGKEPHRQVDRDRVIDQQC